MKNKLDMGLRCRTSAYVPCGFKFRSQEAIFNVMSQRRKQKADAEECSGGNKILAPGRERRMGANHESHVGD